MIGTSGAFAQIGIKADAIQKAPKAAADKVVASQTIKGQKQQIDLNGRKDGERILISDFYDASTYSFVSLPGNQVTGMGFELQPNADGTFGPNGNYLNGWMGIDEDGFWVWDSWGTYEIPATIANGFAWISLLDIMEQGMHQLDLNVAITFPQPIESYGLSGLDIFLNQVVMRFNSDRYYIDWSNDANFTTYDSIEFNVNGIELNANDRTAGTKRITLPGGTYNANAVGANENQVTYVRLRLTCPASSDIEQPHGYFWFVDDFYYAEVPEDRVEVISSHYFANAYHLIPEGILLDTLVYYADVENTGGKIYDNAQVRNIINAVTADSETQELVYTFVKENVSDPDTLANIAKRIFTEDAAGNITDTTEQRYVGFYAWTTNLPSGEPADYSINTVVTSGDEVIVAADDTTYFSVVGPMVTNEGHYQWAIDRDRLVEARNFTSGFVVKNGNTYIIDEAAYGLEGYEVCLPYTTNLNNTTERWIKGIEVVPAMDSVLAGAQIQGKLRMINPDAQTLDEYVMEVEDAWGVPVESYVYTVSNADLNNGLATDPEYLDVIGPDQFKTIYLEFPNSVRLEAGQVYYACYRMAATGKFSVGTDDHALGTFGTGDGYYFSLMLVLQPNINGYGWGGRFFFPQYCDYRTPMIRMILGTEASLPEQISVVSSLNLFPNPANNEASISYSLNKSGNVSIVITDIMGRTVKTINQGNQVAGEQYNVNLSTSDLANGTYFYTMNVNGEKQTKKFVVNR